MEEVTGVYEAYLAQWPELVPALSAQYPPFDRHKAARNLSLYQLLALPLSQPLIWSNFLAGVARELKLDDLQAVVNGCEKCAQRKARLGEEELLC